MILPLKLTVIYIYSNTNNIASTIASKLLRAKLIVDFCSNFLMFATYSVDSKTILFVWPFGGFSEVRERANHQSFFGDFPLYTIQPLGYPEIHGNICKSMESPYSPSSNMN